jgi:hypothetical protein
MSAGYETVLDAGLVAFMAEREGRDPLRAVLFALTDLGQVTPAQLAEAVTSVEAWVRRRPALEQVTVRRGERLVLILEDGALEHPGAREAAEAAGRSLKAGGQRVLMVDGSRVAKIAVVPADAEVEVRAVRADDEQPVAEVGGAAVPTRRQLADDEPDDAGQTAADVDQGRLH